MFRLSRHEKVCGGIARMSRMKKYLVGFGWKGQIIYRVAEGHNEGEARINVRNKHWSEFKKSVLNEDEKPCPK